jgi:hypothetical protein
MANKNMADIGNPSVYFMEQQSELKLSHYSPTNIDAQLSSNHIKHLAHIVPGKLLRSSDLQ